MNHSTKSTGKSGHLGSGRSLASFLNFGSPAERIQSSELSTWVFPALLANFLALLHTECELGCSYTCMPMSTNISQDTGQCPEDYRHWLCLLRGPASTKSKGPGRLWASPTRPVDQSSFLIIPAPPFPVSCLLMS